MARSEFWFFLVWPRIFFGVFGQGHMTQFLVRKSHGKSPEVDHVIKLGLLLQHRSTHLSKNQNLY